MLIRSRNAAIYSIVLVVSAWGGWLEPLARAQAPPQHAPEAQRPQEESDYALTFGRAVAMPGQPVAVSMFFTRRSGVPNIRNLRVRLSFPTGLMSYDKTEVAYLARRAGVEIRAVQGGSGNDGTLDLTFALPASSEREFPSGQIAYVHFTLSSEAKGGATSLRPQMWIEEKPVPSPDLRARVDDARVIVSTSPILVGCFFFTH